MSDDYAPYDSGWAAHTAFDAFWDDVFPEVSIGSLTYSSSRVLKLVDPIAYREEFNNWLDNEQNQD